MSKKPNRRRQKSEGGGKGIDLAAFQQPPALPEPIGDASRELLGAIRRIEGGRSSKKGARNPEDVRNGESPRMVKIKAAIMLNNCVERGAAPPEDLRALIAFLLTGESSVEKLQGKFNDETDKTDSPSQYLRITRIADFEFEHPDRSLEKIAERFDLDRKTLAKLRNSTMYKSHMKWRAKKKLEEGGTPAAEPAKVKKPGRPRSPLV